MVLNESTRDNMLLPYIEKLNGMGIDTNLGKLKTDLLRILSDGAGIHNLSMRSNFYLAGCARYYFNGDLTVDGNVSLITGKPDTFNEEICNRLNALISILRNSYIDSVGTPFEQPEDFGNLSITALLKKYNHKINLELGIDDSHKNKVENDTLDRNPSVGKNYSFEIIYNYGMATKYERATSPMAWCVTYGMSHFNHYQKNSKPASHLIIFRQDGWENINRQNGIDKSKWIIDDYNRNGIPRPHDPYANSLIAFFQSNESWKPSDYNGAPLITSRWNHGAHDTGSLEADRAYSLQEFMDITGISENDLQRIYEIWKKDRDNNPEKKKSTLSPEEKAARLETLRKLKYAQMRANGGENLANVLNGLEILSVISGKDNNLNKGVFGCKVEEVKFLIDRGQIVFDTICYNQQIGNPFLLSYMNNDAENRFLENSVIIIQDKNVYMVYNYRIHKIVEVEGLNKFCTASIASPDGKKPFAMLFKQRGNRAVLFSSRTGLPIKLPNGRYIFEYCKYEGSSWGVMRNDDVIGNDSVVFIMCDSSSREAYIFNPANEKFTEFDKRNWYGISNIIYLGIKRYWGGESHGDFDELTIEYRERDDYYGNNPKKCRHIVFSKTTGEQLNVFPGDLPYSNLSIYAVFGDYVLIRYDSKSLRKLGIPRVNNKPYLLYNYVEKRFLINHDTGKPMQFNHNLHLTKYPKATLLFVSGSYYGINNATESPYLFNLDNERKYYIPSPYSILILPIAIGNFKYFTEEWFSCYAYRNNRRLDAETELTPLGYACKEYYVFLRYEDVLRGVKTSPKDFDVEAAYRHLKGEDSVNESIVKLTRTDLLEMVKRACKLILENNQ